MRNSEIGRKDFLMSIQPIHAEKIVDGDKTVELRRRFVHHVEPGALLLIYSSSPIRAIIGYVAIAGVRRLPVKKIWSEYGKAACVCRGDFDEYFAGAEHGYAILLGEVKRFTPTVAAAELRKRFSFVPPQSFRYLPREYYSLLDYD